MMLDIFITLVVLIIILSVVLYRIYIPKYKRGKRYVQYYTEGERKTRKNHIENRRNQMEQTRKYRSSGKNKEDARFDQLFDENFDDDNNSNGNAEREESIKLKKLRRKMKTTKPKRFEVELDEKYFHTAAAELQGVSSGQAAGTEEKRAELKSSFIGRNALKTADDKKIEKIRERARLFQTEYENRVKALNDERATVKDLNQENGIEKPQEEEGYSSIYQQGINNQVQDQNTDTSEEEDRYNEDLEKKRSEIPSFAIDNNAEEESTQIEAPVTQDDNNYSTDDNNNNNTNNFETGQDTSPFSNETTEAVEETPSYDDSPSEEPSTTTQESNAGMNNDAENLFFKTMGYENNNEPNIEQNNEQNIKEDSGVEDIPDQNEETKENTQGDSIPSAFGPNGPLDHNDSDIPDEEEEEKKKKKEEKEQDFEPLGFFDMN